MYDHYVRPNAGNFDIDSHSLLVVISHPIGDNFLETDGKVKVYCDDQGAEFWKFSKVAALTNGVDKGE